MEYPGIAISATKPAGKVARILEGMGVHLVPMPLDEGNVDRYLLGERVAAERFTGSALLRGIQEKTLFTSAIYLREHFAAPVLIVEGAVDTRYSQFDPRAVRGALSALVVQYGVTVLSTPDAEETAQLLAMMARHEQLGVPEISLIPKRKAPDLPDRQRRVVEMLPGCGMLMARQLLRRFGSVRRIMDATEDELLALRGVGRKRAREMIQLLNAEYRSVDTEKDIEDAIEAEPSLLFEQPVELLARQHFLYAQGEERCFIDLVFLDHAANEVILCELKLGDLVPAHREQLRRYLANARRSPLLAPYIEAGAAVRGILATVGRAEVRVDGTEIAVHRIERERVIEVLARLREAGRQ